MPRRKARTARNTDKKGFTDEQYADAAQELLGVDLGALLADPTNRDRTRDFNAAAAKLGAARSLVLAFGARDGEVIQSWAREAREWLKLDAQIVGNLGERLVEVPRDPVARLCGMLGLVRDDGRPDKQKFFELVGAMPALAGKEEKVIDVGAGDREAGD